MTVVFQLLLAYISIGLKNKLRTGAPTQWLLAQGHLPHLHLSGREYAIVVSCAVERSGPQACGVSVTSQRRPALADERAIAVTHGEGSATKVGPVVQAPIHCADWIIHHVLCGRDAVRIGDREDETLRTVQPRLVAAPSRARVASKHKPLARFDQSQRGGFAVT